MKNIKKYTCIKCDCVNDYEVNYNKLCNVCQNKLCNDCDDEKENIENKRCFKCEYKYIIKPFFNRLISSKKILD